VADPLNPAAWNRFSYVYGNPVNLTDLTGHCPVCMPLLIMAGGVLGGEIAYAYDLNRTGRQANAEDLLTYMGRGGLIGATIAAFAYGDIPVLGGATTIGKLYMTGFSGGVAEIIVTGVTQGGYKDLPLAVDTFMSGFYTTYGLGLTTSGLSAAFQVSKANRAARAIITGFAYAGYRGMTKRETAPGEFITNFGAGLIFGFFSPVVSDTGQKFAKSLLGISPRSPNPLYPAASFASDYLAQAVGYFVSASALAGIRPPMLKLYRQSALEKWEWFVTH
jgi:hypothetical protein